MKKIITYGLLIVLAATVLTGFSGPAEVVGRLVSPNHQAAGKAWWYTYYLDQPNKKLLVTRVYNNDCNHCTNTINAAFKKWLVLNDYKNNPSSVHITSSWHTDRDFAEEQREKLILKYKNRSYSVINLSFTHSGE